MNSKCPQCGADVTQPQIPYAYNSVAGNIMPGHANPIELSDDECAILSVGNVVEAGIYEWQSGKRIVDCKIADTKTGLVALMKKRSEDYSDWIWENLERASMGKELLPRLPWDVPKRKPTTYGDDFFRIGKNRSDAAQAYFSSKQRKCGKQ